MYGDAHVLPHGFFPLDDALRHFPAGHAEPLIGDDAPGAAVPSAMAHQPTEKGCELPLSNDRKQYQLLGTANGLMTFRSGDHTSPKNAPATTFQSPLSHARRRLSSVMDSRRRRYFGSASMRCLLS